ncbi:YccT family protein [Erwinia oleae]|uniref:YccT family protein n=1 Tax=Erwinia oleae TaxID=796334 RepID=UPI00055967A7|nr:DUF2057 family protein [Erwinia oleae]
MKLRLVMAGLLIMVTAASSQATTLKLASDIDLLVLDGRKISGSLLKGADGLELDRGQHQLLFRVEKDLQKNSHRGSSWISAPLIVTFTAQAESIAIKLPPLETLQQGKAFDKHPYFELIDEHGATINSQRDYLSSNESNFEQAMIAYNLQRNVASVPRFAQPHLSNAPADNMSTDMVSMEHPTGRLLQLWYRQVDSATRQRLVLLMQALRTS